MERHRLKTENKNSKQFFNRNHGRKQKCRKGGVLGALRGGREREE
jgi:hypothetical protein